MSVTKWNYWKTTHWLSVAQFQGGQDWLKSEYHDIGIDGPGRAFDKPCTYRQADYWLKGDLILKPRINRKIWIRWYPKKKMVNRAYFKQIYVFLLYSLERERKNELWGKVHWISRPQPQHLLTGGDGSE
jgi:hypothetical protein